MSVLCAAAPKPIHLHPKETSHKPVTDSFPSNKEQNVLGVNDDLLIPREEHTGGFAASRTGQVFRIGIRVDATIF